MVPPAPLDRVMSCTELSFLLQVPLFPQSHFLFFFIKTPSPLCPAASGGISPLVCAPPPLFFALRIVPLQLQLFLFPWFRGPSSAFFPLCVKLPMKLPRLLVRIDPSRVAHRHAPPLFSPRRGFFIHRKLPFFSCGRFRLFPSPLRQVRKSSSLPEWFVEADFPQGCCDPSPRPVPQATRSSLLFVSFPGLEDPGTPSPILSGDLIFDPSSSLAHSAGFPSESSSDLPAFLTSTPHPLHDPQMLLPLTGCGGLT